MGIRIKIVKITTDNLNKKIIIPALVIPGKRTRLGVNEIKILFENNKKNFTEFNSQHGGVSGNAGNLPGGYNEFGNYAGDDMLSRMYYEEMVNFDKNNDRDDAPTGEGLSEDFGRRISAQMSKRGIEKEMGNNNFQERGQPASRSVAPQQNRREYSAPADNIAIFPEPSARADDFAPSMQRDNMNISPQERQYDKNKDYETVAKGSIPSDDIFESRFLEYSGF